LFKTKYLRAKDLRDTCPSTRNRYAEANKQRIKGILCGESLVIIGFYLSNESKKAYINLEFPLSVKNLRLKKHLDNTYDGLRFKQPTIYIHQPNISAKGTLVFIAFRSIIKTVKSPFSVIYAEHPCRIRKSSKKFNIL